MAPASVVIVGAGHGGFQVAASLRQNGFDGGITLIGDEPQLPYQRPPLSKDYLSGKIGLDLLLMRPEAFFADQRIELAMGVAVSEIDRAGKAVVLEGGKRLAYDHLVLATGARNRVPPLPGIELDGVCYLRNLAETETLKARLAAGRNAVVIGAGFIGLEFAAIARAKDIAVHVVELVDRVMARVVCPDTSAYFGQAHQKAGAVFSFGARVERIGGEDGKVTHVVLGDGRSLPADLVLISIGVVPNEELAAAAGLKVENGISVDEQLLTADPNISAIGDCASFPSRHSLRNPVRLEAVQNATDHARCVAGRLVGKPYAYEALPWFWSEQGDLRLQIAGLTTGFQQV
ncbi:MAG TPA: FAD-dependent oxidoreductase, partial [Stellaceae bacterium]|nr:FAD-dependent oxidoreductase [Stellaceae bacterium]